MSEVTETLVMEVLATVVGPDGRRTLTEAGMISGVAIKERNVQFSIEIDPKDADRMEPIRKAAEAAVDGLDGVLSVTAILTAERAAPSAPSGDGAKAADAPPRPGRKSGPTGVANIVAVASGKGGVGKSTTAVNLALALKDLGLRIGLLDADVFGPSQPRMLGISGRPNSPDGKVLEPMENFGVKAMSIGFLISEDQPVVWRGPMVMGALQQMLADVAWGELDVLIVDMPPGTGDAQLTMAQNTPLAGAVIVSTPQDIALIDARKGLNMFRKVDVPVLGIIENMSVYVCPSCGHEAHIFGHGGARREAESLAVDFLGEIPLDIDIRTHADDGDPIVIAKPDSPHTKAYRDIATTIWSKLSGEAAESVRRAAPSIVVE
ncbi:MAG: iron-sulfur cluster carrier protein ApbC [Alphaproteobacteria bacterium]|nr:iron-sulfur cluster carrier protein ApbC [Alphaproteobacteria bacterium]